MSRLEPVILELEREPADILFVGHASVIRCVLAYLQGLSPQEIPNVELRRGDVVQVTPSACEYLVDSTCPAPLARTPCSVIRLTGLCLC